MSSKTVQKLQNTFSDIEDIIADVRKGKMVIMVDDEDRENEGDLIMAAEKVRPEDINYMARYGRGLICLTLTRERCAQLRLPLMVEETDQHHMTNFTVSIEATKGITTGISAHDRAKTVQTAVAKNASPDQLSQPGHIFPLKAIEGGVLSRAGHTEAACDLSKLAGLQSAGVICEIMNEDGTMARRDDLVAFGKEHELKVGTIADLIDYRLSSDSTVEAVNERNITNEFGEFKMIVWRDMVNDEYHFSLSLGDLSKTKSPLVRVQTQSILQDTLGIEELGKKWSIRKSLERISEEGAGIFVLINHRDDKSFLFFKNSQGSEGISMKDLLQKMYEFAIIFEAL